MFQLIMAGMSISAPVAAQTTTYCDRFGTSVTCRTTAPQTQQKSGLEQLNETLSQIRRDKEARARDKERQELDQQLRENQIKLEELNRQAEQARIQYEQALMREAAQRQALQDLNRQVSIAVLEHRCEDAKVMALSAGQLAMAERAMRLCTPAPKAPIIKGTMGKASSAKTRPN
jgi:hypothetical protein